MWNKHRESILGGVLILKVHKHTKLSKYQSRNFLLQLTFCVQVLMFQDSFHWATRKSSRNYLLYKYDSVF